MDPHKYLRRKKEINDIERAIDNVDRQARLSMKTILLFGWISLGAIALTPIQDSKPESSEHSYLELFAPEKKQEDSLRMDTFPPIFRDNYAKGYSLLISLLYILRLVEQNSHRRTEIVGGLIDKLKVYQ